MRPRVRRDSGNARRSAAEMPQYSLEVVECSFPLPSFFRVRDPVRGMTISNQTPRNRDETSGYKEFQYDPKVSCT